MLRTNQPPNTAFDIAEWMLAAMTDWVRVLELMTDAQIPFRNDVVILLMEAIARIDRVLNY